MINLPDVYFLPEWGHAFQDLEHGEARIFEFTHKTGHIYYQFIKRRIPDLLGLPDYFDIITPYGFSGPLIVCPDFRDKDRFLSLYFDAFKDFCLNENIVSEYVRFNPWLKNHLDFGKFYDLKYNNFTLYTDLTVADFFLNEYDSSIRTKVRKAIKYGVRLEFDFTGSSIGEFYRLYKNTLEKNDIPDYYHFEYDFMARTFKYLNNIQFIINALYDGHCITSAIFLNFGDYIHYHLVSNDYQYYSLNANSLILYEAANWGQKRGKKQMHLGGAPTKELLAFKKKFTKSGVCDFYVGRKIWNEDIYGKLVTNRLAINEIKDNQYFPLYRG